MLPFFTAPNLTAPNLSESAPWDFKPDEKQLAVMRRMPKAQRRAQLLNPKTAWNVYSSVRGSARNLRVAKTNPPAALRGLVADYDMIIDLETVEKYMDQVPEKLRPQFVEVSLGLKIRLVWVFAQEVLCPSTEFCFALIQEFFKKIGVPTLLAGYDSASEKPSEMWTNGGDWYVLRDEPLSWDFCFGVVCEVSKKTSLFANGEIPLEKIAEEVEKRFPGRWSGEFKLDATGVRFWEPTADAVTGCQIKPDGMLAFTGTEPFLKWEQIFGRAWVEEMKVLNLGKAGSDIFFDGKLYWEKQAEKWVDLARVDTVLRLKGRGLSDKAMKGATQTDVERVLDYIQQVNRVTGAAPMVNYPPGIVALEGRRILNIANLEPVQPVAGPAGEPEKDFPWLWRFHIGFLDRPEALDYLLAWLQRSYRNQIFFKRFMGQAVYLCGPKDAGKTLWIMRVAVPLLGNRTADPMNMLTGESIFTDDLFECACLAINDSDAPKTEGGRQKMLMSLKALTVNPVHTYHPKFQKKLSIEWIPRVLISLNDDPGSTGILMEVGPNTKDKFSFFSVKPYAGEFPERDELEAIIARELPFFAHWLLNVYQPPVEVLAKTRMGVKSYYDPRILMLAHQQTFSSNLGELLGLWMRQDAHWDGDTGHTKWLGTPTDLLSCLQTCEPTAAIARDWDQHKIARSLTSLAKQEGSGVEFASDTGRDFKIVRIASK